MLPDTAEDPALFWLMSDRMAAVMAVDAANALARLFRMMLDGCVEPANDRVTELVSIPAGLDELDFKAWTFCLRFAPDGAALPDLPTESSLTTLPDGCVEPPFFG